MTASGPIRTPRKTGLRAKRSEIRGEIVRAKGQMADEPDDEGIVGGKVENPLVVFQPGAGLDHDGARHRSGFGQGAVFGRQDFAVENLLLAPGPGDALRPGGVVEMGCGNR